MALRLTNIRINLEDDESKLYQAAARKLKLTPDKIKKLVIIKKAIDARRDKIIFVYTIDVQVEREERLAKKLSADAGITMIFDEGAVPLTKGNLALNNRPIIVGAGPAGLFAALTLAAYGYRPLVLERGQDVETRALDVENFWENRLLKSNSNVQFGEGGAGTFSDGKLTTRINDHRIRGILRTLVEAGAPEEILYLHKPHIGTDLLRTVVSNLRKKIFALGGEISFAARVTDIILESGRIAGVEVNDNSKLDSQVVIMAIGHSARDTYTMLHQRDVDMTTKSMAVGVRIEHPQKVIDEAQYGKYAGHPKLGAADYQLVYKNSAADRAAFTFCMCPGGQVVGATSETNKVVTNGMSDFSRNTGVANSALVVSVGPEDYESNHPLSGIKFQRDLEEKAFLMGGSDYNAPTQRVEDFMADRASSDLPEFASYRPGVTAVNLREGLPSYISDMLEEAIVDFNRKLKSFNYPEAVLTGVETRTSAPVRITRGEDFQSVNISGLYPAGEGAGYAGGIMSAAVDGIKVAEAIIARFAKGE